MGPPPTSTSTESGKNEPPPVTQGHQDQSSTEEGPVTDPSNKPPPSKKKPRRFPAFNKIWLLLWKNYLLRKRHYVLTGLEILLPIICALLLVPLMGYNRDPRLWVVEEDWGRKQETDAEADKNWNDGNGLTIHLIEMPTLECWVGDWDSEPGMKGFGWSVEGESVDGGSVDGGSVDGGSVDGGSVDGGSVDGGSVDGGSVDGGSVDGGSVDGGSVDGGSVDGGSVDGGSDDGGSVGGVVSVVESNWDGSEDRKSPGHCKIFYTPRDVGHISNLKLPSGVDWVGRGSESEVEKEALKLNLKQLLEGNPGAAVIFDGNTRTVLTQKKGTLHYGIRFFLKSAMHPPFDPIDFEYKSNENLPTIQRHLDYAIIQGIAGTKAEGWKTDFYNFFDTLSSNSKSDGVDFPSISSTLIVPFLGIGFGILIVLSTMKAVVNERETGIKELMKLSGLPNWMHWTAWTLNFLSVPTVTVTIVTVILLTLGMNGGRIIWLVNPFLLWIVLWLWIFASITFCFFISSFFSKTVVAIIVGMLICVITAIAPGAAMSSSYSKVSTSGKMGICLFPNAALFFAFRICFNFEDFKHLDAGQRIEGAGFGNLFTEFDDNDTLTLGLVIVMLIVDIVLYFVLTLYFEAVLPSEYGVRRPVYFLFTPSFWGCGKKRDTKVGQVSAHDGSENKAGFEREPEGLPVGVEIKNMRKVFGRHAAVDGVSLKMFQGEIFALLGHNGAGKTTTISCCIGMMAPTSGTAIINGFDIVKEMDLVREQIGICPQHNLLFDQLTVDQHLKLFGKVKGLNSVDAKKERIEMLEKLQLTSSESIRAKKLSGGQKRKLSLGISLIGNAKVVFLDEPTSGMDVEARRALWDLLLAERGSRTIILTTHFMEEADVLGDRIGIMAHGKVQCCGTSTFLKRFYGTGYTLSMTMSNSSRDNRNNILSAVRVHVPSATFKEQAKGVSLSSDQLEISLPTEACSTSTFSQMFKSLEEKKQSFGIKSFGLSLTTMDEVFVKVDEAYSSGNKTGKLELVPVPSVVPGKTEENEQDLSKLQNKKPHEEVKAKEKDNSTENAVNESKSPKQRQRVSGDKPRRSSDKTNRRKSKSNQRKSQDEDKNGKTPDPDSAGPEIGASEAASEASTRVSPEKENDVQKQKPNPEADVEKKGKGALTSNRAHGYGLIFLQFKSFLIKRFHYTRRKWKIFLAQVLLPVLLLLMAVLVANMFLPSDHVKGRPKKIAVSAYPKDITTYYRDTGNKLDASVWSSVIGPSAKRLKEAGSMEKNLQKMFRKNREDFVAKHLMAFELTKLNDTDTIRVYSQSKARSMAQNVASNLILRLTGSGDVRLEMTEHPPILELYRDEFLVPLEKFPEYMNMPPDLIGIFIPLGLALLAAFFVVAPIEERLCSAKQLQLMTGVSPGIYWGASFLLDFLVMVIVSLILVIVFILCERKNGNWTEFAFTNANNAEGIVALFLILVVFAYGAVPFAHVLSLVIGSVAGGFSAVAGIHFVVAMIFGLLAFKFEGSKSEQLYITAVAFRVLFSIFPSFGFTLCLVKWAVTGLQRSKCMFLPPNREALLCVPKADLDWTIPEKNDTQYDQCCSKTLCGEKCVTNHHYFTFWMEKVRPVNVAGLGQELIYLFLVGTLYHLILNLWEIVLGPMWKFREAKDKSYHVPNEDQDVEEEAQRVMQLVEQKRVDEDALVIESFSKDYGAFAAVKDVNFGVHHGECFGLLGVNGAGKTTTFRMLTGDESRTSGNAYASGCELQNSRKKFLGKIGYCPQFDGIIGVLTGLEMVQLFGRLRGLRNVEKESKEWMAKVGLTESENVQCRKYSGGMKRRLTAAIALVGDPDILLLDEPTTGVDPVSRREFWKIILSARAAGRAVILTSHSMDEIAACCTRLAIMVNGQLQCLGGIQYLKNKFAIGFSLDVKLNSDPAGSEEYASLHSEINEKMAPCDLKDSHATAWQYQLYDATAPWNVLFSKMEEIKAKYKTLIEDYAISETTLEQVFLSFARMQYPSRMTGTGGCCSRCKGRK